MFGVRAIVHTALEVRKIGHTVLAEAEIVRTERQVEVLDRNQIEGEEIVHTIPEAARIVRTEPDHKEIALAEGSVRKAVVHKALAAAEIERTAGDSQSVVDMRLAGVPDHMDSQLAVPSQKAPRLRVFWAAALPFGRTD